ncbi:MAG: flagellar brake protein [Pseudomonadales bacterium]|nr:flagellar brake protein [Pseudomonadales bacterium]
MSEQPSSPLAGTDLNNLRLRFGDALQIQFEGITERFHVRLIGYLENRSIIMTIPVKAGRLVAMRTGQSLNVRMMVNDRACAFASEVLHTYRLPYPHAHIRYPDELITNNVRKAVRVETRVDGTVINTSIGERAREIRCYLSDISETGAHLVTPMRIGKSGDEICMNLELNIGGIPRMLSVPGVLRARLKIRPASDEREVHYGVEFLPLNDDEKIELIAFVYSKLSAV